MAYTKSTHLAAVAAMLLLLFLCGAGGYRSGVAAMTSGADSAMVMGSSPQGLSRTRENPLRPPPGGGTPDSGQPGGAVSHPKPPLRDTLKAAAEI